MSLEWTAESGQMRAQDPTPIDPTPIRTTARLYVVMRQLGEVAQQLQFFQM